MSREGEGCSRAWNGKAGIFENSPSDLTEAQGQWWVISPEPTPPKWQSRDLNIQLFPPEIWALSPCRKVVIDTGAKERLWA